MINNVLSPKEASRLIKVGAKKALRDLSERKAISTSRKIFCSAFTGVSETAAESIVD